MNVLVIGASGRLGSTIAQVLPYDVQSPTREQLDLLDTQGIAAALDQFRPDVVINAAAYTDVDKAESEREIARRINSDAPHAIGVWAARNKVPVVHFSTDFVFSGAGDRAWSEVSETGPINHYGVTKLEGERRLQEAAGPHLIIRTSWLFGRRGGSFLRSVLRAASKGGKINVVADQVGSPTFTEDLADGLVAIMRRSEGLSTFASGVLHLANAGWVSRANFAERAISGASQSGLLKAPASVVETLTASLPSAAQRPLNSRLGCTKAALEYGVGLPSWEDALSRCLRGFAL
jgi:dTDP-4-dehydrorhamnose reductase